MIASHLKETVEKIAAIARENGLDLVFMGGIAVSAWGIPRATYDVDLLLDVGMDGVKKFLKVMAREGLTGETKKAIHTIKGLSYMTLTEVEIKRHKMHVDVFLAKGEFAHSVLARKRIVRIGTLAIPLISPEDLIIYKLIARRERNLEDIQDILAAQKKKLDIAYIGEWAEKTGVAAFWKDELNSSNNWKQAK